MVRVSDATCRIKMRKWSLKTTRSPLPLFLLFDIPATVFTENELFMDLSKSADKITLSWPNTTDHQSCILKLEDAPQNNLTAITQAISITIAGLNGKRFQVLALGGKRELSRF